VPVDKYRIRKKHPPPRSIFDGEEEKYKFKKKDRKVGEHGRGDGNKKCGLERQSVFN
jgi:hypothetical protein